MMESPPREVVATISLLILSGCADTWPPNKAELSTHFQKNKEQINRLVTKLEESEYAMVLTGGMVGLPTPNDANHIRGKKTLESIGETVRGDSEWTELFARTKMFAIRFDTGVYKVDLPNRLELDDRSVEAIFVKGTPKEQHECKQSHEQQPCGKCYSTMEDSWGVEYYWTDRSIIYDLVEQTESGLLDQADYDSAVDNAIHECMTKGYEAIGYSYEIEG